VADPISRRQPLDAGFKPCKSPSACETVPTIAADAGPSGAAREGISAPRCRLTSLISPSKHNVGRRLAPVKERQHASVLIAPADPLHRHVDPVLIATFGPKVEVLVNTVEHVDAAAIAGIGVEYLTSLILGEDADCGLV
jgi:hypothetical protein